MDFKPFAKHVHDHYERLAVGELYRVDVGDIFASYLAAFPEGTNPIYRERTVHDCQCCKQFIRTLGTVVGIDSRGSVVTVWDDGDHLPHPYNIVSARMAELIRQAPIKSVYRTCEPSYGMDHNFDTKTRERHDHFHGTIHPKHHSRKPEEARGEKDAIFQVFKRGLQELRLSDLEQVIDLIDSNALYRGHEHRTVIVAFKDLKQRYTRTDAFIWSNLSNPAARFRNTVIGSLVIDLSSGVPLEDAVRMFESKVAPANYKRPTALITPRMVEEAAAKLEELGLEGAIHRRYARLGDVSVNNVLFVDKATRPAMKDGGVRGLLADSITSPKVKLEHALPVTIDKFTTEILPGATSLSALVTNPHLGHFVSLTGGDGPERLFKWDNNFAWSYDGDVADSIKERVKRAGGNVNALLRVSLSWYNSDDLDIHAVDPNGRHIYFGEKHNVLDVDMNAFGPKSRTPVENLAFKSLIDGEYTVWVNQFNKRENVDFGFTLELEYEGRITQYRHEAAVPQRADIAGFKLTVKGGKLVSIEPGPSLIGGDLPSTKWSITTGALTPVAILLNSPNHWDGQSIGQKHWFFMLKGCLNPDSTRGIYNEFLRGDLEKHRKVFEVLGNKTKCPFTEDQISGIGFTNARGDNLIVVVDGKRAYNISF